MLSNLASGKPQFLLKARSHFVSSLFFFSKSFTEENSDKKGFKGNEEEIKIGQKFLLPLSDSIGE